MRWLERLKRIMTDEEWNKLVAKFKENREKKCMTCKHRIKMASNYRCEYTTDAKNYPHSMRYDCIKYEVIE